MANDEPMMDFQKLKENIRTFPNGGARIIWFWHERTKYKSWTLF
jgi:hypothetical protein